MRKRTWMLLALTVSALGVGLAAPPKAERPHAARLERLAEVLGLEPEALRARLRQGQTPREIARELGLDPLELERRRIALAREALEVARAEGRIAPVRAELLERRLQAMEIRLDTPSLAELLQEAGVDLEAFTARLVAVQTALIEELRVAGVLSEAQAERLKANLEARVAAQLKRPLGLRPGLEGRDKPRFPHPRPRFPHRRPER
ncbi:hypothetical protein [Marinithermus hydrothermalis]|uniref:Periplasmic heavy metal sensor n=1 Tax=Marinithermus hydrothermalis (strain DSM 14884 / JCM 11576 / T1) TaxID=869210 RepID=F2NNH3_MARHT|nr:hypothetical protein [Marinithermus hydrothermalis]AEB10783.1 hypothetical protein Marky_0018 [Marinithermus hydrothermalis DSM 14884]